MKKLFVLILIISLTRLSLFAQEQKTLDYLFSSFIQTDYYHQITDTLPNLFYEDSTLWSTNDLALLKSVSDKNQSIPVTIGYKKWKLIDWNSISRMAGTSSVQIFCEEKCFNKYEISISVPLINPRGHKRKPGECCEDTHYILGTKYVIREKKGVVTILEVRPYFYLNLICTKFL